tara:strand:- start:181 stop:423 length:243 start_codon:yes stop_codon:yes gene_type:complete
MAFKMKGWSPFTQTKTAEAAASGALVGGAGKKHPLYEKLTADEKKKYNALSTDERINVNKNKELHQLKNALGGPGEEDDK